MVDLSVVLISRNQEWNIARLIASVLSATSHLVSTEIVLVDSASTDKTIDLARRYPITIIRLRPDQHLTAAAGRYVGCQNTSGRFVLFLDGDMELRDGWIDRAIAVLTSRADAALVNGNFINRPKTPPPQPHVVSSRPHHGEVVREVPWNAVCGIGLYRRSVLEQVGTFNPYLYSDEELELCLRIHHAHYRLFQLDAPAAYHYSDPDGVLSTAIARWRRNLYRGFGQVLRYHIGDALFWPYVRERGYGLVPLIGLVAGLGSLGWALKTKQWGGFLVWSALCGVALIINAYRKHSLYHAIYSVLQRLFVLDGTLRGLLFKPNPPESYANQWDVIQVAPPRRGHAAVDRERHGQCIG